MRTPCHFDWFLLEISTFCSDPPNFPDFFRFSFQFISVHFHFHFSSLSFSFQFTFIFTSVTTRELDKSRFPESNLTHIKDRICQSVIQAGSWKLGGGCALLPVHLLTSQQVVTSKIKSWKSKKSWNKFYVSEMYKWHRKLKLTPQAKWNQIYIRSPATRSTLQNEKHKHIIHNSHRY